MKIIHTTVSMMLLLSLISSNCFGHWYEIDARDKVIPVSRIAEVGKISVFIVGTSWCAPCKGLKKRLRATKLDLEVVDFYYVTVADNTMPDYRNRLSYKTWRKVEGLNAFPMIYITAPTTNIVSKFGEDEYNKYDRILNVIGGLQHDSKGFESHVMLDFDMLLSIQSETTQEIIEEPQEVVNSEPESGYEMTEDSSDVFTIQIGLANQPLTLKALEALDASLIFFKPVNFEKVGMYYGAFSSHQEAKSELDCLHTYGYCLSRIHRFRK